ncbi:MULTISPECIES: glycoside hydrolase N-terminal domain-containing protein [unclassified Oceanispirochaeta]|uniref:glycosyl hydrolase family 95 catalytic domain-containing protein n=1 Tax=unclassified Oceanispirochaeta TaxID=2635722 RepID=UPI000E096B80|nr:MULTISPECIES: glycoside hydrolase N-terminal domain-containing protein [unclassified Oceanispirochaeta]MBF9014995.1 glycoside hydrolase family 95 protein [Oceanispirochaeta sp. M2]NPD71324.1 glycoside hydrolase family 95 protein [Oceanispirochaeta sp. M1]RDG33290.1 glycoside hydrolase family 95 protein [Oceanispirochaeta sp. M1]
MSNMLFNAPAKYWEESILLGNGTIGISTWGGLGHEKIQLNHDCFWAGTDDFVESELSRESLKAVRELIQNKQFLEAEKILIDTITGPFTSPYQPMGEISFNYDVCDKTVKKESYRRSLDLDNAMYSQEFSCGSGSFQTEGFVSYPASIAVLKFSSENNSKYDGRLKYDSPYTQFKQTCIFQQENDWLSYSIRAPYKYDGFLGQSDPQFSDTKGIKGFIRIRIKMDDGKCVFKDDCFEIQDSTSFTVFIQTDTDWNNSENNGAMDKFLDLTNIGYLKLKEEHLSDYHKLYLKVELSLGSDNDEHFVLLDRLLTRDGIPDKALVELLFNYGRYLLISSSRPGSQPANLQGIWNPHINPPWWSNMTLNINTEMNYWGACLSGLSECALPLYDFMMRLMENGRITAEKNYHCDGWCAHHQSDIWAKSNTRGKTDIETSPESAQYSLWPMSGLWLSLMAWEQFEFTNDLDFLNNKVLPLLEGSIQFLRDFLIEDAGKNLTTNPSTSPENRFLYKEEYPAVSQGSTMDLSISLEAVTAYLKMSTICPCDAKLVSWCKDAQSRIKPFNIGRLHQLQEWSGDWDREDDVHRHVSHLFSLFPGSILMKPEMADFRKAAGKSLEMRGLDATGWSTVWKIALMARLNKTDGIRDLFGKLLTLVKPGDEEVYFTGSGVYPNLMCAHPPFQIDGNLGIVAAISEILIQQTGDTISILPSLPEDWENGCFKNVHCKSGINISLEWGQGKLTYVKIKASKSGTLELCYKEKQQLVPYTSGETLTFDSNLIQKRI